MFPPTWTSFPIRSLSGLSRVLWCYSQYIPHESTILNRVSIVYIIIPIFRLPPPHCPWYPNIWSLCLCLYFCFANKIILYHFSRFHIYIYMYIWTYWYIYIHIYTLIYYIFIFLTSLCMSLLGPSTCLYITQFVPSYMAPKVCVIQSNQSSSILETV